MRANRFVVRKAKPFNNMATINRKVIRGRIHSRIRRKVSGTPDRPRLCVYFSGKHVYAQVVDDEAGRTLVSVGTTEKDLKGKHSANRATAEKVGKLIAERLLAKNIDKAVFDRGGFLYHGKVKALADAAREGGLKL